jgi:hypothetical protein
MWLHEKYSLLQDRKSKPETIVGKSNHFSLRILLGALSVMTMLMGGASVGFSYQIDFTNACVHKISGLEFLGEYYDVTFGVESEFVYEQGTGWVTDQVVMPPEEQLPENTGIDFFQTVADILAEPFYNCADNDECSENNGNVYSI